MILALVDPAAADGTLVGKVLECVLQTFFTEDVTTHRGDDHRTRLLDLHDREEQKHTKSFESFGIPITSSKCTKNFTSSGQ